MRNELNVCRTDGVKYSKCTSSDGIRCQRVRQISAAARKGKWQINALWHLLIAAVKENKNAFLRNTTYFVNDEPMEIKIIGKIKT
jgi:hypothetical protein